MEISNLVENPLLGMILLMAELRLIYQTRLGMLKSPHYLRQVLEIGWCGISEPSTVWMVVFFGTSRILFQRFSAQSLWLTLPPFSS